ncbi:uncharacterized protein LOC121732662 [Aricia agestis]|uniref:uncharacterized protein LOC121732662 n=1 Tax=Aricia agestis TaxID=91739 RepID=UPI001C203CAC|nr:uncharacterized protein LOC121732662 [Aricia agestis]
MHLFTLERRSLGESLTWEELSRVRKLGQEWLLRRWGEVLAQAQYGQRTAEALRPVLAGWMRRKRKPLTFRLTQVLTGHGCFGAYLCKVARREPTPACHDCGAAEDTAQHTIEVCDRWAVQRHDLVAVLGGDLSLPSMVRCMLESDEAWQAAVSFCEYVISQKETAERNREDDSVTNGPATRGVGVLKYG